MESKTCPPSRKPPRGRFIIDVVVIPAVIGFCWWLWKGLPLGLGARAESFKAFYSFGVIGFLILPIAGFFCQTKIALLVFGVLSGLMLGVQSYFLFATRSAGEAWGGDSGTNPFSFLIAVGGLCALALYFCIGWARLEENELKED